MKNMELDGNQIYVYILGILLTVVAVIVSTRYTLSNIKRLWDTGKPKPTVIDENDKVQGESFKDDPAGGDHTDTEPGSEDSVDVDPVEYCEHIQSEVKKVQHRVAERQVKEHMSADEVQAERELQRQQLEQIYRLMEQNGDKFGVSSMEEIQQQMKLYA